MVSDLGLQQELTIVYCDSQSVMHLTRNQMYHEKIKHIDVIIYFIRDVIEQGAIVVKKSLQWTIPHIWWLSLSLQLNLKIIWIKLVLVIFEGPFKVWEQSNLEDFQVCLNLRNLSQGKDCWKVLQIVFWVNQKVIDSFLIENILVNGFSIIINKISYYEIFF